MHARLAALERENAELRRQLRASPTADWPDCERRLETAGAAILHADPALMGRLTDAMPAMIAYIDRHERYRFVNNAFEEWFGRDRGTIIGQTVREVLGPEAYAARRTWIQAALRGELARFEGRTPHRDGTSRDTETQYVPHVEPDDGIGGFFMLMTDVTERKRGEAANARLAAIVSSSPDAVMSFSPDGLIQSWNAAAEKLFGYTEAEALGATADLLVPSGCPEGPRGVFDWGLAGRSVQVETVRLHKDGTRIDVAISAAPMRAACGAVIGVSAIMRDITERKRAEARLRDGERRLRETCEHARVGIAEVDLNGRFLSVNEQFCSRSGYSRDELSTMTFMDVTIPEDIGPDLEQFARLAAGEIDSYSLEKRCMNRAGQVLWVELATSLVRDKAGRPLYAVRVTRDISERKRAEDRQRLLVHELNHRIKNTLATVQAIVAQTLRHTETPDQVRQALTSRLLSLAEAHNVLTRDEWKSADLAYIVSVALKAHQGRSRDRIQVKGPSARIEPRIALSLSMALHELATNATKYGALSNEEGRVAVSWRIHRHAGARRLWLRWMESGGPPVAVPTRKGFGSRLIERSVAAELGGEARIAYRPTGVVATIAAPVWASKPQ